MMRRGEIRFVDLDPVRGSEASNSRPAVVVSNDIANATGLPRDSKAQAEQVRSVAVEHVGQRQGVLPAQLLRGLDEALRRHLALQ
ncbi:MAG: type II toxin-antitoxin system PemK/MazF family toxin [Chloroflexi bacterium]|nr:type II toxin-antitoxin system PemK/MazF family toxin [Chloroflexota bacterium]